MRIYLDRAEAAASVASLFARLDGGRSKGQIILCVQDPATGREIDLVLPNPYPITPQIKGAIKAIGGVVAVEEM